MSRSDEQLTASAKPALFAQEFDFAIAAVEALSTGPAGSELDAAIAHMIDVMVRATDAPCTTPADALLVVRVALHAAQIAGVIDHPNWQLVSRAVSAGTLTADASILLRAALYGAHGDGEDDDPNWLLISKALNGLGNFGSGKRRGRRPGSGGLARKDAPLVREAVHGIMVGQWGSALEAAEALAGGAAGLSREAIVTRLRKRIRAALDDAPA